MLWSPVTAVRGWHLGTATDAFSAWIWTSARRASSVSSYTPPHNPDSHTCWHRVWINSVLYRSHVWSEQTQMWMCVFLTRWCKAWGPRGRPWDGEHGICLWPLPGAHCGQQDQLQRVWRLWPVLRLLPCKEVSRQVTYLKFNLLLLKPTYFLVFSIPFFFLLLMFPSLATFPPIGSQCTPWWPYE